MFQAVGDSTWVYVLACNQKDLHKICPNLWNFRTDHVQRSRVLHIFLTLKARAMSQRLRQVRTNRRPALWPIFFRKIVLYLFVPPSIFPYLSQGFAVYPSTSVEKTIPAWFLSVYLPRWLNLTKAVRTPFVTEGLRVLKEVISFSGFGENPPSSHVEYPTDMVQIYVLWASMPGLLGRFRDCR
jgi:hypothetical protein